MYLYYDIKVTLQEASPAMWRRFLLPQSATFNDLHRAVQDACGWQDYHLFAFREEDTGKPIAGIPDLDVLPKDREPDAKRVKLVSYFESHDACEYEYDFGDGWLHHVERVGTLELPYKFKRALLDGERAFPPEDCGGIGGYERLVKFLETGEDEWGEEEELREWIGAWRPERFDLTIEKRLFDK